MTCTGQVKGSRGDNLGSVDKRVRHQKLKLTVGGPMWGFTQLINWEQLEKHAFEYLLWSDEWLAYQPKSPTNMWLKHGLDKARDVRIQFGFNLCCFVNGILPWFVWSVHSVQQISSLMAKSNTKSRDRLVINNIVSCTRVKIVSWSLHKYTF